MSYILENNKNAWNIIDQLLIPCDGDLKIIKEEVRTLAGAQFGAMRTLYDYDRSNLRDALTPEGFRYYQELYVPIAEY